MKIVFDNGKIYTGELPFAEAFAVEDGRFVFVGNTKDALALAAPGDELEDLQGRFVCAGFNDSHMHILNYGQALLTAKLDEHTGSLADLLAYVRAFAAEHPVAEGAWLKGRGWNQDYFTDVHRMPDRYDLDTISTEYPICLVRCCGHCLVVNSKALEILGITADTPQPEGGSIGMTTAALQSEGSNTGMAADTPQPEGGSIGMTSATLVEGNGMGKKDVVFPSNRYRARVEPFRHPLMNLPGVGASVSILKPSGKKNIEQFSAFANGEVGHFRHFVVA